MEIDYTKVAEKAVEELAKDTYIDAVQPAARNVGGAMGTLTGFFNHVVLHPLKKLNIEYEQKAIAFQRDMEKKYNNIPEENQAEPQLNIVGPTMESLKYNIMDDDLAEMFSNLLVSDMDKTTQGLCTPSFVKVIEQLTPYDAKTFITIYGCYLSHEKLPLCRIQFVQKDNPKYMLSEDAAPKYFTSVSIMQNDSYSTSKSLQNLQRVGLLSLNEGLRYYTDSSVYNEILICDEVMRIAEEAKRVSGIDYMSKLMEKGIIELTDFSYDFAKVCLREK